MVEKTKFGLPVEVECRLCKVIYRHPVDSTAGYGLCDDCFNQMLEVDIKMAMMENEKDKHAHI